LKKQRKSPKNERDSCMPGAKNGERPYLAVPEATFWGLFSSLFSATFPVQLLFFLTSHTAHPVELYFYYRPINQTTRYGTLH